MEEPMVGAVKLAWIDFGEPLNRSLPGELQSHFASILIPISGSHWT